jgi:hypothetical protein
MPARKSLFDDALVYALTCKDSWNHFTNSELKNNHDDLLRAEVGRPEISFVFQYISH